MNDEGLDKAEGVIWGIYKWIGGTLVFLLIFSGIFWALFYSVNLANLSFIIPL